MENHPSFVVSKEKMQMPCATLTWNHQSSTRNYTKNASFFPLSRELLFTTQGFFFLFFAFQNYHSLHFSSPQNCRFPFSHSSGLWLIPLLLYAILQLLFPLSGTWVIFFAAICYKVWFSCFLTSVWVPSALMMIIFCMHWILLLSISSISLHCC